MSDYESTFIRKHTFKREFHVGYVLGTAVLCSVLTVISALMVV